MPHSVHLPPKFAVEWTDNEWSEIRSSAERLRKEAQQGTLLDESRGAPRRYFKYTLEEFRAVLKVSSDLKLHWTTNNGFSLLEPEKGEPEGWSFSVVQAYAPRFYWVAAQCAHNLGHSEHEWHTLPGPVTQKDVLPALEALSSPLAVQCIKWSQRGGPSLMSPPSPPWKLTKRFGETSHSRTYFGVDEDGLTVYVSSSAKPAVWLGKLKRKLMGVSGKPREDARLRLGGTHSTVEFVLDKAKLKTIAKMSAAHVHRLITRKVQSQ